MWYMYTVHFYSAVKKNEITKVLGKQMGLIKIVLSEVTQTQKDKCCVSVSSMVPDLQYAAWSKNNNNKPGKYEGALGGREESA